MRSDLRRLFTGVLAGGAAVTYTISGVVYDANGTTPIEGATVTLGALSAVTAANGTYTINDVPAGASGSMTCVKTGYSWTAISVNAMSGNLTAQNYTNAWWAAGGCGAGVVAAYNPLGAASLAESYINLANPGTNDVTVLVAPTLDSGWSFGGTHALKCVHQVSNDQTYSLLARCSDATANGNMLSGVLAGGGSLPYYGIVLTAANVAYYSGSGNSKTPSATSGVFAIAGTKAYRNGVDEGLTLTAQAGTFNNSVGIGCGIGSGGSLLKITAKIQAWVLYSTTLSAAQVAAVSAAMAALNP